MRFGFQMSLAVGVYEVRMKLDRISNMTCYYCHSFRSPSCCQIEECGLRLLCVAPPHYSSVREMCLFSFCHLQIHNFFSILSRNFLSCEIFTFRCRRQEEYLNRKSNLIQSSRSEQLSIFIANYPWRLSCPFTAPLST